MVMLTCGRLLPGPGSPSRWRRQISTRASARAGQECGCLPGPGRPGRQRARRACRTITADSQGPEDRGGAASPTSPPTDAAPAGRGAVPPPPQPPAGRCLLPLGQHPGDLLGRGRSHLGHQGGFVLGELLGAECLRLSQHPHPRLGHLTGSERLPGLGHLLQGGSHRYLAAARRHRLPRQGSQPRGGRPVSLLTGRVGAFRLSDDLGPKRTRLSVEAGRPAQQISQRRRCQTLRPGRQHRTSTRLGVFAAHPTYISPGTDTIQATAAQARARCRSPHPRGAGDTT